MNLIPKLQKVEDGRFMLFFTIKTKEEFIEALKKDPKMSRFGYTFKAKDNQELMEIVEMIESLPKR